MSDTPKFASPSNVMPQAAQMNLLTVRQTP